ncbi:hypothetical protein [Rhizobium sp. BK176]|uniref:hypothetical protein n=1 Tax=Rhizobium sp. BK176 TaxID=2587071 RepID=UPI002168F3B4|nr:hypothetical protein [Rhizobium sp. BK176]MCS4089814.1 hypothetical protein [Rhizobium sp. BK176]
MKFKPLVSDDEFRAAEADIEAVTREISRQAQAAETPRAIAAVSVAAPSGVAKATNGGDVRAEIRTRTVTPGLCVRMLALVGITSPLRRILNLNRIARTVDLGCASGLASRPRSYETVAGLYSMANDPKTATDELPIILGWVQAIVVMTCPSVTPAKVRAA